jgi:hypothetical protein
MGMPFGPVPEPAPGRENPLRLREVPHPERAQPSEQISVLQQVSVEALWLSDLPVDVAKTDHSMRRAWRAREEGRELVHEVSCRLGPAVFRAVDAPHK